MAPTRRLAANVAGYSRLMGSDEGACTSTLKTLHHQELIDPKIREH
jgi:hypothetical protein